MFPVLKSLNPNERRSVALLFLYGFGNAAAYVLARTIADSAFLSHIGPEQLPKVYMLSAGVVALSSLIYARIVQNVGLRRVVLLTLLGLAGDLDSSGVFPPVLDAVQDHPAALDWRLVVAFVALGVAALYLL